MAEDKSKAGAIIAGIAGLTAAAVGAYYLYGHKDAAKNRAKVKSWMLKAKGDVLEELEKAQDVTESAYMTAVDAVARKYNELKTIDAEELAVFIAEMKDHWNGIKKTIHLRGKAIRKSAPKKAEKSKKGSSKNK
ncbi:MAG TPA: hypothetical protein VFT82_02820 [Candidatus Paceibacterota bacterium]|nr:hypothetical protein [Candidatus Paceibacterota bacterium]